MKNRLNVILYIFLCLYLWQAGCVSDAERKNPLDPKSDRFDNTGVITGQALTFFAPFSPLTDVEILLQPGPFLAMSDAQGQFRLEDVPTGSYTMTATKEGYATVTDTVVVAAQQNPVLELHLNGLPVISSFSVRSCRINRWPPATASLLLEIDAGVDDPDGVNDIRLVELEVPEIGFRDTLEVTQVRGQFSKVIFETQLPGQNVENMLGREFFVTAHDQGSASTRSDAEFIARIIDVVPVSKSPLGFEAVSTPTPEFIWQPVSVPFDYTFRIDIFSQDLGRDILIFSQSGIAASSESFTIPQPISPGNYLWHISVVDAFGNWSRSKPVSFIFFE